VIITVISLVYAIVLAPLTDPQGISVYQRRSALLRALGNDSGLPSFRIATQVPRIELYIDGGEKQANTDLLHRLQLHGGQVQADMDEQVHWAELPEKRACRIAVYRDPEINDQAAWPQYIRRLAQTHQHLAASLQPLLSESS
jgi:hypothetical protein